MAHNFLGLNKVNPNGHAWQPQALQYAEKSYKIAKYVYVWYCSDTFLKLPITTFFLKSEMRKKNYYAFRDHFKRKMSKLVARRLKSNIKIKLYKNQISYYLLFNRQKDEDLTPN